MSDGLTTLDDVQRNTREHAEATARAYAHVFGADSEDVRLVLEDLRRFCHVEGDMFVGGAPDTTANMLGRFRVWQRIEGLRARNVEVLLLGKRIDAWVMDHLQDFEGKQFKDATRGDLDLGGLASAADKEKAEAQLEENKPLLKRDKDALGERGGRGRRAARHPSAG